MSIAQPECVYVVLGIRQAMRMRHIAMCGLLRSTVLLHIIKKMTSFSNKNLLNIDIVFLFSVQNLSEIFFILKYFDQ